MNKKSIFNFQVFSVIFSYILGAILHFTFEWSGENSIVGIFSSVNESTWEHLKLVFFPMMITVIIGYIYFKNTVSNFICSKLIGIITAMTFIVVFFYTYTGIIGTNFSILDIGSFFIAILLGEYISYKNIISGSCCKNSIICIAILLLLTIIFAIFTYFPPEINLFRNS